ncbi:hypothetical protein BpHYR1_031095 [Brachionus plicatilis]|uniref:Uncharacterized protein n=1 Tax=Brachionus plicatilis TaxID=10195 RepID=A0A3M7SIC0_BRAPC|nr:hypothetical protein BpHYR1_031095 [Brachionus plicatilis]
MIPFTNWREDNDESQAILKRSEEIRNLIDNVHPEAAKNIKLKQIKQKIIQDNDNNVTDERIPISSTVFIKCEGLLTKLEPRFKGPYKVNDYTKRGNFSNSVCSHSTHSKIIDNDDMCSKKPKNTSYILQDYLKVHKYKMIGKLAFQKFYLFGKLSNQVYGNGYQCEKKKNFLITSMSFF